MIFDEIERHTLTETEFYKNHKFQNYKFRITCDAVATWSHAWIEVEMTKDMYVDLQKLPLNVYELFNNYEFEIGGNSVYFYKNFQLYHYSTLCQYGVSVVENKNNVIVRIPVPFFPRGIIFNQYTYAIMEMSIKPLDISHKLVDLLSQLLYNDVSEIIARYAAPLNEYPTSLKLKVLRFNPDDEFLTEARVENDSISIVPFQQQIGLRHFYMNETQPFIIYPTFNANTIIIYLENSTLKSIKSQQLIFSHMYVTRRNHLGPDTLLKEWTNGRVNCLYTVELDDSNRTNEFIDVWKFEPNIESYTFLQSLPLSLHIVWTNTVKKHYITIHTCSMRKNFMCCNYGLSVPRFSIN